MNLQLQVSNADFSPTNDKLCARTSAPRISVKLRVKVICAAVETGVGCAQRPENFWPNKGAYLGA